MVESPITLEEITITTKDRLFQMLERKHWSEAFYELYHYMFDMLKQHLYEREDDSALEECQSLAGIIEYLEMEGYELLDTHKVKLTILINYELELAQNKFSRPIISENDVLVLVEWAEEFENQLKEKVY